MAQMMVRQILLHPFIARREIILFVFMSNSIPPSPPPPPIPVGFSASTWWRQGTACKVLVVCVGLILLMLFQPWDFGVAGSYTTEPGIGSRTYEVWSVQASGTANAFAQHEGWIPLICLALILYFCGQVRRDLGGRVWIPFWAALVLLLCAMDAFRTQSHQVDAWLAGFDINHRPQAQIPAAIYWTNIFGLIMAVAGWRFAKSAAITTSP